LGCVRGSLTMASNRPPLFEGKASTCRSLLFHCSQSPNFKSSYAKPDALGGDQEHCPSNPFQLPVATTQSPRLYRSPSFTDQLNQSPRYPPPWGHTLPKAYSGTDWPLPPEADDSTTSNSTPGDTGITGTHQGMFSFSPMTEDKASDPERPAPKKRGPKPKNEPAQSVSLPTRNWL
jgi:hypothetical protein